MLPVYQRKWKPQRAGQELPAPAVVDVTMDGMQD
jgi:hypothetical protein